MTERKPRKMIEIQSLDEIPANMTEEAEHRFWGIHSLSENLLAQMAPLPDDVFPPGFEEYRLKREMELGRERGDYLRAVFEANADLDERARQASATVTYDRRDDLLAMALDRPSHERSLNLGEDLWLIVDAHTSKIVGVELYHLTQHVEMGSKESRFLASLIEATGVTSVIARLPSVHRAGPDPLEEIREFVEA